jgi:hypothetical protein
MMPLPMARKTCRMEKVENLYRTARAQDVIPRLRYHATNHIVASAR